MVVSSEVSGISVLREVGIELDGVFRDHVQFGSESVKITDNTLEFLREAGVLFLQCFVMRFMMCVGVAEGFNLKLVRMKVRLRLIESVS
jgi:hypothetical protein